MVANIVEINNSDQKISLFRGFLKVSDDDGEKGRVPLDDITALIISAHNGLISKNILVALAERNTPVIICGKNWHPVSISYPVTGHYQGAGILYDQIEASQPLRKRMWQTLIAAKISNQTSILARHWPEHSRITELVNMSKRVKSGDPDNLEAQAARLYWPALMGNDFRRNFTNPDQNILLNYGYTVLRAATARAVCSAGLTPALGIHHRNRNNAFCLVDDLVEPFRPLVDDLVCEIWKETEETLDQLTPEIKKRLVTILTRDLRGEKGASPLVNCLSRLAKSVCDSFQQKENVMILPELIKPGQLL